MSKIVDTIIEEFAKSDEAKIYKRATTEQMKRAYVIHTRWIDEADFSSDRENAYLKEFGSQFCSAGNNDKEGTPFMWHILGMAIARFVRKSILDTLYA